MVGMPQTYDRVFRIRAYECDAYGHVNHANYLRYMQEAAIEASASVGYDNRKYNELGHFWLIRETDIEYRRPLFYGDVLTVRTWVEDFRRVRSRRRYEFRCGDDPDPVASASTDWIYLERARSRPAPIPPEMVLAFIPEGVPETAPPRDTFPEAPEPPPGVHIQHRSVEWRDIDSVGHVNNAVYLSYNEDVGLDVARARGWDLGRMLTEGWRIFTRRNHIEYRQPAVLGDALEIETWLSPPRNTSITRHYRIRRMRDGALLAQTHSVWVIVDNETQRPIPVPQSFLEIFSDNISRS